MSRETSNENESTKQNLVLVGAGYTHLQALAILREKGWLNRYSIRLVHPTDFVEIEDAKLPLKRVAQVMGVELSIATPTNVDPVGQWIEVETVDRQIKRENFDFLSFDFSLFSFESSSDLTWLSLPKDPVLLRQLAPDARRHQEFETAFSELVQKFEISDAPKLRFVQVGAGRVGCETLLRSATRLKQLFPQRELQFTMIERGPRLLPEAPEWTGRQIASALRQFEARIMLETRAKAITNEGVELESGILVPSDFTSLSSSRQTPLFARSFRNGLHPRIFTNGDSVEGAVTRAKDLIENLGRASRSGDRVGRKSAAHLQFVDDGAGGDFSYWGAWPLPHLRANRWLKLQKQKQFMKALRVYF